MDNTQTDKNRSTLLDALKGVAVCGMIAAHAMYFFYSGSNPVLDTIEKFLNLTVFTLFVFASGIGTSFWLDTQMSQEPSLRRTFGIKRTIRLWGVYAILVVAALATTSPFPGVQTFFQQTIHAVILLAPPSFTEYFPFFILLSLLLLVFRPLYLATRKSLGATITIGILSYIIGIFLYGLTLPPIINDIKLLFAGGGDALRFPILFYFPVYLLGLWWHGTTKEHTIAPTSKIQYGVIIGSIILTITGILLEPYLTSPLVHLATRWPPSITNIILGVTVALMYISFLSFAPQIPGIKFIYQLFSNLGKETLYLWGSHLAILFLYQRFIGTQFEDAGLVLLAFLLLLAISVVITIIYSHDQSLIFIGIHAVPVERKKLVPLRFVVAFAFFGFVIISVIANSYSKASIYGDRMPVSPLIETVITPQTVIAYLSTDKIWYTNGGQEVT
jgi:hypothetical protein